MSTLIPHCPHAAQRTLRRQTTHRSQPAALTDGAAWARWAGGTALVTMAALAASLALPATALPAAYHAFADQRTWLGLPHVGDVLSNLAFALMALGLASLLRRAQAAVQRPSALRGVWGWTAALVVGLMLTALGSSVYHWQPDDLGLLWDRLGMAGAFAAVLGLAVHERVSARAALAVAAGVACAAPLTAWWAWAMDNHTPWAVMQVAGLLALLALSFRPARPGTLGVAWWAVVAGYALAKGCELADHRLWQASLELASGHSLKHVVAAMALLPIGLAVRRYFSSHA